MHRNLLYTTVFSAIFFICFLGMRNPYIHDNHRPKANPRATIEETTKPQHEISKSHHLDVAAEHVEVMLPESLCFSFVSRQFHESPSHDARQLVARAPPVVPSRQI